ncbi:hypothetical protein B0A55_11900 [Friedmanniomyces simplex]|uniref:Mitochondrial thiamine pyrophosphate carrier 1 n=1 Tax=Friedmanniomyces simplex TaxID=329884 RepID=A0A4V5N9T5_9PEZI|nr:hypothetical protein B0A55_11900 [Friedmanniomyces simplex]
MSADFWAGYVSGAVGIIVGNPLDILKTKLQAGTPRTPESFPIAAVTGQTQTRKAFPWTSWLRGSAAPILGYGALNALLFVTYNRSLSLLNTGSISSDSPERPSAWRLWTAGALGGLATFLVSAPTELVKCRAQVSSQSSLEVTRALWKQGKLRGLYLGGGVTSVRDAVGYGFYFWSYELVKHAMTGEEDSQNQQALKILLCGGLAGVVTWTSIFPLDVLKTRVQTWDLVSRGQASSIANASQPLLSDQPQSADIRSTAPSRPSTFRIAREAYAAEGVSVFFRGLAICNVRAFIVNAVQWAAYEYLMKQLAR